MTTAAILLILVALAILVGPAIATFVRNDGYGHGARPPRSHLPDLFDPRRSA